MDRLKEAIEFATTAHQGQVRKVSGEDYVIHPIAVGNLLKDAGFDEDVVIAGYLHDTVEDTNITFEDIEKKFGSKVVELVKGNTENKSLSWIERKTHTIESVKIAPLEIKALIAADKLDNLQSLVDNFDKQGNGIWEKFKGGLSQQEWYYKSVVESVFEGVAEEDIPEFFYTLKNTIEHFFN